MKPVEDLFKTLDNNESQVKQIACVKSEAKGYFSYPNYSDL